jgi:hypothetical protein
MESNSGYPTRFKTNGSLVGKTKVRTFLRICARVSASIFSSSSKSKILQSSMLDMQALSTNMLYYNGYYYAAKMARILTGEIEKGDGMGWGLGIGSILNPEIIVDLEFRAESLREEIRNRFWLDDEGFYSYLEDENFELLPQMEGLGEALVLLSDAFEDSSSMSGAKRIQSILSNTFVHELGIPSLWPQFDLGSKAEEIYDYNHISERYHNGRIWPFVQGYWAIAAARHGRTDVFARELLALIRLSNIKDTFAEFYELDGSFPGKRRRQLWSATGFLGMIYQGMFGMVFGVDGIAFRPVKPTLEEHDLGLGETISLTRVKYRTMILDIHISGNGNDIDSFKLNGVLKDDPFLPVGPAGEYVIEIELAKA